MLASAILTVDTAFIGFFLVFLALCVSTFIGLEMRRGAEGAAWTPLESGTPAARRLHTALGLTSAAVALSALVAGAVIFLVLPRFRAGYLSGFNLQPGLISGFSDEAELGRIGADPAKQRSGHAHPRRRRSLRPPKTCTGAASPSPVLTGAAGSPTSAALARHDPGWRRLDPAAPAGQPCRGRAPCNCAIPFCSNRWPPTPSSWPPSLCRFAGNSPGAARTSRNFRRTYLLEDKTGSLSNPFHNFANVRYDAVSEIPRDLDDSLRRAPLTYSTSIREMYLQLPELDPRIPALARADRRRRAHAARPGPRDRTLPARQLRLHARPGRARTRRSARRIFFSRRAPATASISPRP